MARDLVLGNGNLLVCLDRNLFVRDLYWPHVGLYNHLSNRAIRFGVWTEGKFAWFGDEWEKDLRYRPYSLVTDCHLRHDGLEIALSINDLVDYRADTFVRRMIVRNLAPRPREVRLFLAADTDICETNIGDTCYYDPYADAVIHYKRDNYLLFNGDTAGKGLFGYACGMKGLTGNEGTWRDCEDGVLSGNRIAQGTVDSAISLSVLVGASDNTAADFWITVGESREKVMAMQEELRSEPLDALTSATESYWRAWVKRGLAPDVSHPQASLEKLLSNLSPRVQSLFRRSLLIIRTQIDNRGAILAANDTSIMIDNRAHYSYMWPRDGALVAHALDTVGYSDITRHFFEFCRDVLPNDRAALMHKYGPDGTVGSSWHSWIAPDGSPEMPLQEDETALPIWSLWHHYECHRNYEFVEPMYRAFVRPCANFLLEYRDKVTGLPKPSWDLWEERRGIHTYTVCAVIAALEAAAKFARLFGHEDEMKRFSEGAYQVRNALIAHLWNPEHNRFARRLEVHGDGSTTFDMTQDASLHALYQFDVLSLDDPKLTATMQQINDRLWVKVGIGGMARYEGDYYARISDDYWNVPGNPWIICTLWKAQWQIAKAKTVSDLTDPADLLEWANLCALPSGVLAEQVHPFTFTPLSVAPLTWSHAEVVETVCRWLKKFHSLTQAEQSTMPNPVGAQTSENIPRDTHDESGNIARTGDHPGGTEARRTAGSVRTAVHSTPAPHDGTGANDTGKDSRRPA